MPNFSYDFAGAGAVRADSLSIDGVDSDDYVKERIAASQPGLMPLHDAATANITVVAGRAYARFIGKRAKVVTSVDAIVYRAAAAAAGTGWAEIAVATGEIENVSGMTSTDLTVVGYASIDTEVKAGGVAVIQKTISGLSIPANTGIWIIVAASYDTTQATFRNAEDVMSHRSKDATQPSTIVDTPTAFTTATAASIQPWLKGFIA